MAHKKKGGSKKPSTAHAAPQANGTSSPREDAAAPATFKDAILKDAVVDGTGKIGIHASSTSHLTTSVLLSQQRLWDGVYDAFATDIPYCLCSVPR